MATDTPTTLDTLIDIFSDAVAKSRALQRRVQKDDETRGQLQAAYAVTDEMLARIVAHRATSTQELASKVRAIAMHETYREDLSDPSEPLASVYRDLLSLA